ncbi:SAM-dependent methyltransferase [Yoonia sp.]|uniref:SAM-dependent methyltransferase n=1 Tax=Yoonia sp. TaxID=2212373 RepID=UPI001A0E0CEE|nr:SAM-dependent methyltransferase [Yoonia sp.]MBE0413107.1 SAM-dependent methyltransferase [Yoonia sp.]
MTQSPQLVDRTALLRNRARAQAESLFLHEASAAEVHERLNEVNRTFKSVAIVTGFPDFWRGQFPDATVVHDDDTLALRPGVHDLVLHTMALHWANDPVGQLVQCRHALEPDGLLIAMFLGGQTLHELRRSLAEAEAMITGGLSPRIAPMGEIRDLGALLQRAGFGLPVADGTTLTASYANAFHLMHDLRKMGENNALVGRPRHITRRNILTEASSIYAANFHNDAGRVDATFDIITLTGWAPSETQPQPLRPGSAKIRLADALGTVETPLNTSKS